ncbi:hypothetical protein [Grimontia sedimenti]
MKEAWRLFISKSGDMLSPRRSKTSLATAGLLALIFLTSSPVHAQTQDAKAYGYSDRYGELTPTEVFSLVKNLDAIVMHYAYRYKPELASSLPRKIIPVQGYTPDRVFIALTGLSKRLNVLADDYGVPKVQSVVREQNKAIPAEVFLLAGSCLDTLAHILSVMEPENSFGDFYNNRTYRRPKTPSDVYALVDLIDRKLIVLLGEQVQQIE